jgi:hypothetical protein
MIPHRHFKPADNQILYHYCTPATFLAICQNRKLRFSDLNSMNDFMELHWGYHQVWLPVANKVLDELGRDFIDSVDSILSQSSLHLVRLASCFSKEADVLSQWRAYAGDGAGYCIGFHASHLAKLAVRPLEVEYSHQEQCDEVEWTLRELARIHKEDPGTADEFFATCANLAADLAAYKNPAFAEEGEVRLLHLLNVDWDDMQRPRLKSAGGESFGIELQPLEVVYTMRGSVPVPHVDLGFDDPEGAHPIVEVILGPKNDAIPVGVNIFLETLGLDNVQVRRSGASYR